MALEASHGTFGGWGYIAGWKGDGTWIDVHVHTAGASSLTLRYAAADGDASRLLFIDGHDVVANQRFAATGSWDVWQTVTISVSLSAGDHTVSVIYNGGKGSSRYLNLDWIELAP